MINKEREEIFLFEKEDSNEGNTISGEIVSFHNGIKCISGFYVPMLKVFRPQGKINALSIIICPGGGYENLAIEHEGNEVAESLIKWGITAFVLKYRLPQSHGSRNEIPLPLVDIKAAYKIVQKRAYEWGLNPASIGLMGFSAGGHLVSLASSLLSMSNDQNNGKEFIPPLFTTLIYPVISFSDELTHLGSRNRFLGPDPDVDHIKRYSSDLQVNYFSPPVFLVHCSDDMDVSVENSISYCKACLKKDVSVEMHLYPKGGHGFGMHNAFIKDRWMERLMNWLSQFL